MSVSQSALNQSFIDVICSLPSFQDLYISKDTLSWIKHDKPSLEEGFTCLHASYPSLIIANFGVAPWYFYVKLGKGYLRLAKKNPVLLLLVTITPLILIIIRFIIASHHLFHLCKSHQALKKNLFIISKIPPIENQPIPFLKCLQDSIQVTKCIIYKQYFFQAISASSALLAITGLFILIISACLMITISHSSTSIEYTHSIIKYCSLDISLISSAVLLGVSSIGHFFLWIISTFHSMKKMHSIDTIKKMLDDLAFQKKKEARLYANNP